MQRENLARNRICWLAMINFYANINEIVRMKEKDIKSKYYRYNHFNIHLPRLNRYLT